MDQYFAAKYSGQTPSAPLPAVKKEPVAQPMPKYTAEVHQDEQTEQIDNALAGLEATPEELAGAATKISAVFRGKKAREEVSLLKAELEASKAASANPDGAGQE
jgi:type IV secretory pathway VirB10-like protein